MDSSCTSHGLLMPYQCTPHALPIHYDPIFKGAGRRFHRYFLLFCGFYPAYDLCINIKTFGNTDNISGYCFRHIQFYLCAPC